MNRKQLTFVSLVAVLTVLVLAIGTTLAGGQGGIAESGLSDSEREELHLRLKAEEIARQRQFLEEFVGAGQDPRKLEQHPYEAERGEPRESLETAVKDADRIVYVKVESQRYELDDTGAIYTVSTLMPKWQMKGPETGPFEVRQPGGPRVEGDHAHLIVSDANPPIFVGEELVVFVLEQNLGLFLQAYTGQYKVAGNRVSAHTESRFASFIDGLTVDEFKQLVAASAKE
jgi:hypothetical protein